MAEWFFERLRGYGDTPAIIEAGQVKSYRQLLNRVGIVSPTPGKVTAIEADFGFRAISTLLSLVKQGKVIVPLSDSIRVQWPKFLEITQTQAVYRFLDGWQLDLNNRQVTHDLYKLLPPDHPGLVLFSSGSTGDPKAALHDLVPILDKFREKRHKMTTIPFLLWDHIGGINTLLYTLANGGLLAPVSDRQPATVCAAIEQHRVELLPTSPSFLALLLASGEYKHHDLSSLKRITYGTEPMPEALLHRLNDAFPDVKFQQTYGLSELGILRSKSRANDNLWVKVGGEDFQTKVIDGRLWVKAKSSMLGYLNAPSPFDEKGWFDTGDRVEVDGEWLRFLGRDSDLINVAGQKVYPAEVESVLLEYEAVQDALVWGQDHLLLGQVVAAQVKVAEITEEIRLRHQLRAFCRERLEAYKVPALLEFTTGDLHTGRFKKCRRG